MIQRISECVGCPSEFGCTGRACQYQNVLVCECDECGEGIDTFYEKLFVSKNGNKEICLECMLKERLAYEGEEKVCHKCGQIGDAGELYEGDDGELYCIDCIEEFVEEVDIDAEIDSYDDGPDPDAAHDDYSEDYWDN